MLTLALLSLAVPGPVRDLWVTSDGEPVEADVQLVALAPQPCPCDAKRVFDRANVSRDGIGGCLCPASVAQMRRRLARCATPRVLESKRGAHVVVERAGPMAVAARAVVAGEPRVAWLTTEKTGDLSVELRPALLPRFIVVQDRNMMPVTEPVTPMMPAIVQGALLYDDGRCVPLVRTDDAFVPAVRVPKDLAAHAVFLDEAGQVTPWYWHAYHQSDVEVRKAPADTVRGTCAPNTSVRATHAIVDATATSDARGHFVLTLPRGPAVVTCGDKRWLVEGDGRWLLSGTLRAQWVPVTAGDEQVRLVWDNPPK